MTMATGNSSSKFYQIFWWVCLLLFLMLQDQLISVAAQDDGGGNAGCNAKWMEAALYFGATLETFSRGFCLGFGIRMMKFTWIDGKDVSLQERLQLSSESGLAVASIAHGAAIFLPHHVRQYWLDYK